MRKKIACFLTCCLLTFLLLPVGTQAAYTPSFEIASQIALIVNTENDRVMYEKNADQKAAPPFLPKMVAAAVAMENCKDLDNTLVTAPSYIFDDPAALSGTNADIRQGETLTMRQLLSCMMLQSANEASLIIADYIGQGDQNKFLEMMNRYAENLGCKNTRFTNPHGLYDAEQYTTANDVYRIAKAVTQIPGYMDLVNTMQFSIPDTNKHAARTLINNNYILDKTTKYYYEYAKGIKTGATAESGRCLVTTASKNGYTYLCVIIGSQPDPEDDITNYAFIEARQLLEWAFTNFSYKVVVNTSKIVADLPVTMASHKDRITLVPEKEISSLIPSDVDVAGALITPVPGTLPEEIPAPISKGQVFGQATVTLAGETIATINLVASEDVERSSMLYAFAKLRSIFTSWWFRLIVGLILSLVIIYIILTVLHNNRRRKRRKVKTYRMR